jgi:hypothetical protein
VDAREDHTPLPYSPLIPQAAPLGALGSCSTSYFHCSYVSSISCNTNPFSSTCNGIIPAQPLQEATSPTSGDLTSTHIIGLDMDPAHWLPGSFLSCSQQTRIISSKLPGARPKSSHFQFFRYNPNKQIFQPFRVCLFAHSVKLSPASARQTLWLSDLLQPSDPETHPTLLQSDVTQTMRSGSSSSPHESPSSQNLWRVAY